MKRSILIAAVLLLIACLTGCSQDAREESGYQVYVTNQQGTKLLKESLNMQEEQTQLLLAAMLQQMRVPVNTSEHYSIIPGETKLLDYTLTEGQLTVTFDSTYLQLEKAREILLRAGLVMTVTQLEDVRTVVFHVGDDVLRDSNGEPVGAMTGSQFLVDPVGSNSYKFASLALYFSNRAGSKVVRETRNVHYSSNTTLERVVMEQLLSGPMNGQLLPILPADVNVLDIKVEDDTCTVNLSKEFLNVRNDESMLPEVVIYAIVNSLCDVLNVENVQFQVEGQSNVIYKEKLSLEGPFHRNSELIETMENTGGTSGGTNMFPFIEL